MTGAAASLPTAVPGRRNAIPQSQWRLIGRRFARHRLAMVSLHVLIVLYLVAVFAEVVAPYGANRRSLPNAHRPPQARPAATATAVDPRRRALAPREAAGLPVPPALPARGARGVQRRRPAAAGADGRRA